MKTFIILGTLVLSWLTAIPAVVAQEPALQTVVFRVGGMVSRQCPRLLEASASNMAGIFGVAASYAARQATVEYDPAVVTPSQIGEWIERETGFTLTDGGKEPVE